METNILGLPSLTGFTPLKAAQKGQVLKYDFKEIGPRAIDKSGNFNDGKLMPLWPVNSPKRSIPPGTLTFDGDDDFVKVPSNESLNPTDVITIIQEIKTSRALGWQVSLWKHGQYSLQQRIDGTARGNIVINGTRQAVGSYEHKINDGKLHELWLTFDGAKLSLFVDGELDDEKVVEGKIETTDNPLEIASAAQEYPKWKGTIKSVRILNKSITP